MLFLKKGCFLFLLTAPMFSCQEAGTCLGVHEGKFSYLIEGVGEIIIERNRSSHIESSQTMNIKNEYKIRWVNDCSFELYEIKNLLDKKAGFQPYGPLKCQISNVTPNSYDVSARMEGINGDYKTRINIVK